MDVLDGGIVHPTGAAGFGIEGTLKHGPEDCGAYLRPVKIVGCALEDEGADFIVDSGYLDVPGEHSAIDIGEHRQAFIHVGVSVLRLLIENLEQFYQCLPELIDAELCHVVMEHILGPEYSGILGIEAENKPHTEFVERLLGLKT